LLRRIDTLWTRIALGLVFAQIAAAAFLQPSRVLTALGDTFPCLLALVVMMAFRSNRSQSSGTVRLFWTLNEAAFGILFLSQLVWFYYDVVLRRVAPNPVAGDGLFPLANLPTYQWRGAPFAAWLFRIASNALADQYKRDSREQSSSYNAQNPDEHPDLSPPDLETIDYHARLFRLVDHLPAVQCQVIRERFVEQRSIREIAGRLNKTEGAIKQLQFRALQTLRALMEGGHA